jgi:hypothetical protein
VKILSLIRFRLAALYCDEIEKLQRQTTTVSEVLELVACLPDQLYNFYDRILESVSDKTLRRYLTRALFYIIVSEEVQATRLAAMSALTYQSWYSWFGNFIDKPVTCEDIITPLNGLIERRNVNGDSIKLAHFSVAEYLGLATTRTILQEYDFPSNMVERDNNRLIGLRIYALYVYGALYPDRLNGADWYTNAIQNHLNKYLRGGAVFRRADYKVLYCLGWMWSAHRLLFDMVMNITCVYSCHAKRCWELQSVATFSFDLLKLGNSYFRDFTGIWPMPLFYICFGVWQLSGLLPWVLGKLLAFCVLLVVAFPFIFLTGVAKDTNKERIIRGLVFFIVISTVLGYGILLFLYIAFVIVFLLVFKNTEWNPL